MRTLTIVFLGLLLAASAFADKNAAFIPVADVAPNIGPVAQSPPTDDIWDFAFYFDAQAATGDNQLLGAEFAVDKFYVTGGNLGGEPNQVYVFDAEGSLLFQFDQWSEPGWGWRDLAYDGTYLYGSDDTVVDAFDLDGNPVPGMNINGPISPCRALAYDPVLDHFWTQDFAGSLYEFGRDGTVYWSGTSGATAYGAAWDHAAPDGPWLWIFSQTGNPLTTFHMFDPINHTPTGFIFQVPLLPGLSDQLAGGAFMTDEWDPGFWALGGVTQGNPNDMVFLLEGYLISNPCAPAVCENFTAEADPGGALTCYLTWDLPTTTVNGQQISFYPLTSVELLRDEEPLASLEPTATNYTDNVPSSGLYEYTVYAVNDSGDGVPSTQTAWMGLDVPAGVANLTATPIDTFLIVELTWNNPTTGAHGGYFPPGSIDGYIINRYAPSPAYFNLPGIQTNFIDNTIPVLGWYEYGVIAYNASGEGPEVFSGGIYVGPPQFTSIPYDWVEINPTVPGALPGINTGITGDDQNLGPFPMGMNFPYYDDSTYSSIRVCSNGWLSFNSTATAPSNQPIPSPEYPNNLIAPYWTDLNPSAGGSIWYYTDAANDRFICEFYQVPYIFGPGYHTFEVILYADGTIDFMYQELAPGTLNACAVGIENATGTVGILIWYNGSGAIPPLPLTGIRIFPVCSPPPVHDVTIDLTYVSGSPVPATGGPINYNIEVDNNETEPVTFGAWIVVTIPTGPEYLLIQRELTMPGGGSAVRILTLNVPPGVPPGTYTMTGYTGDYPTTVWDQSSFPFSKSGDGEGVFDPAVWTITGWDEPWDGISGEVIPTEFAVTGNYPNPFNQTTTVRFSLPEAANVTLTVYDINGHRVAEMVNGWRQAGVHEAVFDAANLASGVYIYRLMAGSFTMSGKLVLMK